MSEGKKNPRKEFPARCPYTYIVCNEAMGEEKPEEELMGKRKPSPRL
ncbi:hypothetical protein BkAM31D_15380 [Halalkalibacter krulwichiae]|uniref:Uncharacterized protein n=1 Tax=Halalkalibacter krulwichiae TaxID=199441 RepID=A0A1X9MCI4_9BACI|nr:hypothetical protein BkAM31D_15380 [Halalkalibacter krulwichiae]